MPRSRKLTRPDEPSQTTDKGLEIPVPTKEEFESLLKQAAQGGRQEPSLSGKESPQTR